MALCSALRSRGDGEVTVCVVPAKASGRVFTLPPSDPVARLLPVVAPDGPAYPAAEGGHPGVDAGGLLRPAGMAPGRDPVNHPASPGTLAHQRASAVAAATVQPPCGKLCSVLRCRVSCYVLP